MAQTQLKTGKGICPATGSNGNWSYKGNLHNPSFIISYCGGSALAGWVAVGEATTGGAMFKPEQSDLRDRSDEITLDRWSTHAETTSEQDKGKAEPSILHLVYGLMLRFCLLTEAHGAMLQQRGMPLEALKKRLVMGSLPAPKLRPQIAQKIYEESGLSREQILQVPGFFINKKGHLSIAGRQGLLIATLDSKRRIIGFQIRSDRKICKQRYTWLSSSGKEGGTGSGSPASFLGDRYAKVAALTEGAFKMAALDFAGLATASVSIAGVGNIAAAMERLDELPHLEELHIYYDADWSEKPQVLKALVKMLKAARMRGLRVRVWGWNASWGKGIDDALLAGMPNEALFEIPTDGLLRSVALLKTSSRLKTDVMPTWKKPTPTPPGQDFFRQQTQEKLQEAFAQPLGTFVSIGAPTNTGKTYCTNRHVPEWNIRVFPNYAALEESEIELRKLYGEGKVNVLYGRISRPNNPNDEAARQRYARAGCPNYGQMKERAEKGQWACSGCPLAPDHKEPGKETCAYWRHRKSLFERPPEHLLCVIQAFTRNGELLELLPTDKNLELFEEKYTTLVIDDCPDFDAYLSHEKAIRPKDVEIWQNHPDLDPKEPEHQTLIKWLGTLRGLQQKAPGKTLKELREQSKAICKLKSLPCEEEAFEYELPLRAIESLSTWLARGGAIRFEEDQAFTKEPQAPQQQQEGNREQAQTLFYLSPPGKLLERLKHMRVIHLDATPDESKLQWLAHSLGMAFEAPEFIRRTPKIIQVGNLLWNREQIISNKELVKALIHHIQAQGGVALGFKEIDDPELNGLFDGHWGRDERGLNVFKGAKGVGLFGHYALPVEEARNAAFRQRALAWHLGAESPDAYIPKGQTEARIFSDSWRPYIRTMHCEKDPLVEYRRRHQHTSSVVQGADRDRDLDSLSFVLSGEPLDGLSWDVPVELMTKQELRQLLGVSLPVEESREINAGLQRYNDIKKAEAKERIDAVMPSVRQWAQELGELPGVRQTIRFLNDSGEKGGQAIAYKLLEQLKEEIKTGQLELQKTTEQIQEEVWDGLVMGKCELEEQKESWDSLGAQGSSGILEGFEETIEWGVSHTHLKELTPLRPVSDTPHSIHHSSTEQPPSSDSSHWFGELQSEPCQDPFVPFESGQLLGSLELESGPISIALELGNHRKQPEASCWPLHEEGIRQIEQLGESLQLEMLRAYELLVERGRTWWQAMTQCLSWLGELGYQLEEDVFWSVLWWRKGLSTGLVRPWLVSPS